MFDLSSINGGSMNPTLTDSDLVWVNKAYYGIRIPFFNDYLVRFGKAEKGSVVVINDPTKQSFNGWIKRVIATPGDTIAITNKTLFVNGNNVDCKSERVVNKASLTCEETLEGHSYSVKHLIIFDEVQDQLAEVIVPPGHVFVLGDNRSLSADSRTVGFIAINDVIGKQVGVLPGMKTPLLVLLVVFVLLLLKPKPALSVKGHKSSRMGI